MLYERSSRSSEGFSAVPPEHKHENENKEIEMGDGTKLPAGAAELAIKLDDSAVVNFMCITRSRNDRKYLGV